MAITNIPLLEEIASKIVGAGAISIRDVDSGEEPFVYSTGNRGPGYLMIKGLIGQPEILKFLTKNLAHKVINKAEFDFIEGNATGGMIPGWQLRNDVSDILGIEIPFCYFRGSRKEGEHSGLITGNDNNPFITKGMKALVVEELVNYADTTSNAVKEFRSAGYPVSHAACILSYDHQQPNSRLTKEGITLIPLITLPQLLDIAESNNLIPKKAVDSYREFLSDPLDWQLSRGLAIPVDSAQKATKRGYTIVKLSEKEAIQRGAPSRKLKEGIVYWMQDGKR